MKFNMKIKINMPNILFISIANCLLIFTQIVGCSSPSSTNINLNLSSGTTDVRDNSSNESLEKDDPYIGLTWEEKMRVESLERYRMLRIGSNSTLIKGTNGATSNDLKSVERDVERYFKQGSNGTSVPVNQVNAPIDYRNEALQIIDYYCIVAESNKKFKQIDDCQKSVEPLHRKCAQGINQYNAEIVKCLKASLSLK